MPSCCGVEAMPARRVGDIEYELVRSAQRKTLDVVIERDGQVSVHAPAHVSEQQADAVVARKRLWIYRTLAEWRDLNASRVTREWVNGEGFPYLGCSYRLLLVQDQDRPLLLKEGRFRLRRALIEQGGETASRQAFQDFYQIKGQERLSRRVAYFAPQVGVAVPPLQVRETGYQWGTCSTRGELSFHWKCMMAPPLVIDYLVVHELCHLHHRDHTEAFWNEVDKVMPDYYERKTWLRRFGASLDL